jgi:hypothetical protein
VDALRHSLVFEGAEELAVNAAVAELREVRLEPGDMLAEEGQTCWGMCVLESGTLDLFHYDASTEVIRPETPSLINPKP